ncbi:MAG: ABC transporter permease [Planctomycetota bacterium]|jgi:ABC-2 type transport system permease protein|nr:ABC transporter permease [Planctomycetota bacterium]
MKSHFWQETRAQTWRWFLHSKRRPITVISGLMQPIIWMTLFIVVFKDSMASVLNDDYLSFVTPGALLFTSFNASLNAGVPILFDRELGFLDRIRSAPLSDRFSIVLASAIHIAVMTLLQCLVIVAATSILGVSFAGGLSGVLFGLLILVLVILGFTSFSLGLAFVFKRHFEMLAVIMIITLPIIFLSSAFNSLAQLPYWLSNLVLLNPVTLAIEPLRLVYSSSDWSMSTVIFDSAVGELTSWHFLAGLLVFNLIAARFCRKILKKTLA